MKLSFLLFLLLLLCALSLPAVGQTGCNTGVLLTTQAEVDAFSFTGVFDGGLQIGDPAVLSDITNVNALSGLTGITSGLTIRDNPVLTDLSGLSNLTFIGQAPCQSLRLTIWNNPLLADLSAFNTVSFSPLMRSIDLRTLPALTSIASLNGLTGVRQLIIIDLDALPDLDGLDNLTVLSLMELRSNSQLANIDGLSNVAGPWNPAGETTIFEIEHNAALANLNGLSNIPNLTTLRIENCDALQNLSGLSGLQSIDGELGLRGNDGITSLDGINPAMVIGTRAVLMDNSQLSNCAYEPVCDQLAQGGQQGQATISGNATGCESRAVIQNECNLLPIELYSFTANTDGKTVDLKWATTFEENVQEFTLQRSHDRGQNFLPIATVQAKNLQSGANYQYLDHSTLALEISEVYYRLRTRDFDGAEQLFGPEVVFLKRGPKEVLTVYPNPMMSNGIVNVQGAAAGAKIELRAIDGRHLATLQPPENGLGSYRLPMLQPGMYLIHVIGGLQGDRVARFAVR